MTDSNTDTPDKAVVRILRAAQPYLLGTALIGSGGAYLAGGESEHTLERLRYVETLHGIEPDDYLDKPIHEPR